MNAYIGESLLKNVYPDAVKMAVKPQWDESTKIIITQEEMIQRENWRK